MCPSPGRRSDQAGVAVSARVPGSALGPEAPRVGPRYGAVLIALDRTRQRHGNPLAGKQRPGGREGEHRSIRAQDGGAGHRAGPPAEHPNQIGGIAGGRRNRSVERHPEGSRAIRRQGLGEGPDGLHYIPERRWPLSGARPGTSRSGVVRATPHQGHPEHDRGCERSHGTILEVHQYDEPGGPVSHMSLDSAGPLSESTEYPKRSP